ncbi:MAG: hypothetical protein ACPGVU_17385 [Limisphaerales bacterium]
MIAIIGWGAVSPAGWGVDCLRDGNFGSSNEIERPGSDALRVYQVPKEGMPRQLFRHARLRRTSTIGRFAMAAAHEAVTMAALPADERRRLGIVYCTTCGCVNYSRRFYAEVLENPAVASPLIFPETVFNAPGSHLSAVWENPVVNYTLVGDSGVYLQGLAVAANWLEAGKVDDCLVVAAEEADWITADVMRHFDSGTVLTEGAGAMLLTQGGAGACLQTVSSLHDYAVSGAREMAWNAMAAELGGEPDSPGLNGEALSAGAAWQSIMAVDRISRNEARSVAVGVPGVYQFAVGAVFEKHV